LSLTVQIVQNNDMPTMMTLQGGRDSVTAWFGQKDAHCFYTNFEEFKKSDWCTSNEEDDQCIDKCKTGTVCSVNPDNYGGRYSNSNWLMVRSNDGSNFRFPDFTDNSMLTPKNYIRDQLALKWAFIIPYLDIDSRGSASVLLSNVKAGSNGLMTVMFSIPDLYTNIMTFGGKS
jgi:hypothetical protein